MPRGMEMVACSVGGSWMDGLLPTRPFLALTAAISAAVASICAKALLICDEGRYLTLIPELAGSAFQEAVRLAFHVISLFGLSSYFGHSLAQLDETP